MVTLWLSLSDFPAEGREFSFSDPAIWVEPWTEFRLPYSMVQGLHATLTLSPQENGCYFKGRLQGEISAPCDRCAEETRVIIDHEFEDFEALEAPGAAEATSPTPDGPSEPGPLLRRVGDELELDVAALLWEEFLLATPPKPLCDEACKGLCPNCGKNLNQGKCDCAQNEIDPRLQALQGLRIVPKHDPS